MPIVKAAIALSLVWAAALAAGRTDGLLDRVRSALQANQPFRSAFVQQAFIEGQLEIEEKGIVVFKDAEWIKCEYLDPEKKVFLYQKDRFQYYEEESRQLTRGRLDAQGQDFILRLLGAAAPDPRYQVREKGRTLWLTSPVVSLEVTLNVRYLPERVVQTDDSGVRTVYQFSAYRPIEHPSAADFALSLPADVDIIEAE